MTKVTRGWPPERRRAQALRIKQQRPWLHSTGPRTRAGKERSRLNAVKHSMRSQTVRRIKHLMRRQREFLKLLNISYRTSIPLPKSLSQGEMVFTPALLPSPFGRGVAREGF